MPSLLLLDDRDNVAVALAELQPGERIELGGRSLEIRDPIRMGHKVALAEMGVGASVIKYGEVIGIATARIGIGCHAHVHNVISARVVGGEPTWRNR